MRSEIRTARTIRLLLTSPALAALSGVLAAVLAAAPHAARGTEPPAAAPAAAVPAVTAVVDVRVFDGASVLPRATVVFSGGTITAVGPGVEAPAGAEVVAGAGHTLLPGLIDCHTHSWGDALERALVFGVTTHLDMFTEPGWAASMRREQAAGQAQGRADLFSAGILATAPGGHGTQYGIPVPTLTGPTEAEAWVEARIGEGSDYIKLVLENGSAFGSDLPTLSRETATAVIRAARRRDLLAVAHVSTYDSARLALEADASGLVHLFLDRPVDEPLARLAAEEGAFVVPTLVVLASSTSTSAGRALVEDPRFASYLNARERQSLASSFPRRAEHRLETAFESVKRLKAAGVPILAGSDAPNPGTAYGAALHRELELLVEAGLTPVEALAAATSVPARVFGLPRRGRIAPGLAADLLLVEGDPTADVTATRAFARIWKGGSPVVRPAAQQAAETAPAAPRLEPGLVSDFEGEALAARVGFGWVPTTDERMGGASTVEIRRAEGGAEGSGGSLAVEGEIRPGFPFPWAGAMYFPGDQPMTAVDLSAAKELVFWARGDGGTYRVMSFSGAMQRIPDEQGFVAGEEWREVVLPLSGFAAFDPKAVLAFIFSGGGKPGPFRFQIDGVWLR